LEEVKAALEELEPSPAPKGLRARLKTADVEALPPIIDRAFLEMDIDLSGPAPTPEEVQELMLREGVRPEDNIFSRAIIEAREEESHEPLLLGRQCVGQALRARSRNSVGESPFRSHIPRAVDDAHSNDWRGAFCGCATT
jgi:hypothetical protein